MLSHPDQPSDTTCEPGSSCHWVGAWSAAPQLTQADQLPPSPGLSNSTLRQVVFPTLGGPRLRLRISNEYGERPLRLNAVHLARPTAQSRIEAGTDQPLSFDGQRAVTLAPGQTRWSDPMDFPLVALNKLAVTIAFGDVPSAITGHPGSRTTSFLAAGQQPSSAELRGPEVEHWYIISGIDVLAPSHARAVVTLGDSITDGRGSTTDGNDRWPDQLARRLQANPTTAHVAVLNQGIGGNCVLAGGLGPTTLQRFERDVLRQSGVRWVVVLAGVNDIGSSEQPNAGELIDAYRHFIAAAHKEQLLIYGVPVLPMAGSHYDSPSRELARLAVNRWILEAGEFDAVLDLHSVVRDPERPQRLLRSYDSGDQLHLSAAGYRAMADAVELGLFT